MFCVSHRYCTVRFDLRTRCAQHGSAVPSISNLESCLAAHWMSILNCTGGGYEEPTPTTAGHNTTLFLVVLLPRLHMSLSSTPEQASTSGKSYSKRAVSCTRRRSKPRLFFFFWLEHKKPLCPLHTLGKPWGFPLLEPQQALLIWALSGLLTGDHECCLIIILDFASSIVSAGTESAISTLDNRRGTSTINDQEIVHSRLSTYTRR